jgi:hypothetical protein
LGRVSALIVGLDGSQNDRESLAFAVRFCERLDGRLSVIHPAGRDGAIGEHVAVAWSPSPQSVRAVRSAIPLLRQAKTVTIVTNSANPEADAAPPVHIWPTMGSAPNLRASAAPS